MDESGQTITRRDALRLGTTMLAGMGSSIALGGCQSAASTQQLASVDEGISSVFSSTSDGDPTSESSGEQLADASYDASDFVLLSDVVPDIIQEIRYFGTYNFVGERIDGYVEPVAIMCREAAEALKVASDAAVAQGYRLKIWDAYRPQRAVNHFERWSEDLADTRMKTYFYPELDKSVLFDWGYIDHRSGHSRGATVDLTLFDMARGKEVDMGGPFDYFGELSHPDYAGVSSEQYENRCLLRDVMVNAGYMALETEWWHFRLANEPYPDTFFDFPVERRSVSAL